MKRFLISVLLVFILFNVNAQNPEGGRPGGGPSRGGAMPISSGIVGRVIDAQSNEAVEYANVALFNATDSTLVNGTITNAKGFFMLKNIPNGTYNMRVKFIGYKSHTINKISITDEQPVVRLKALKIEPANIELDAVDVTAKQEEVMFKIDKRVINVSENINTIGGTAVDALENTPGVEVDIDGNVSIRGSSNFKVLIDGKPTAMEGSEALQQIPASSIKEIEIITNPSAKYDPDGLTGILNIVMKKNIKGGLNGLVSASVGNDDRYDGSVNLNYRKNKLNLIGGYSYRQGGRGGNSESYYETYRNDTTFYRDEEGERGHTRISHNFKAGIDYDFNDANLLSFNAQYRLNERERGNESFYEQYTDPESIFVESYTEGENKDEGSSYELSGVYIHKFDEKDHELRLMATFSSNDDTESAYTLKDTLGTTTDIVEETLTETTENHNHGTFQADYELPLGSNKLEAGFKSSLRAIDYNQTGDILNPIPGSPSNEFVYQEDIHALYAMFSGPLGGVEYQLGLRGEYSRVYTEQKANDDSNTKEIFTVYPTLHFSYELNETNKLMAGYSRRVHRPRTFFLNPYEERSDAFTIRKGNPDLDPEYAHSLEMNYLKYFKQSFFNATVFYRQTDNNIGRIQKAINDNMVLLTFANINKETSLGAEFSGRHKFGKWLSANLSYSFFRYTIDGETSGEDLSNESVNHKVRGNANVRFGPNSNLQMFGMYYSPSVTSQGERDGFFFTGFGYKHLLLDRKLTLSLRVRNPFGNFKWRFTSEGSTFKNEFVRRPDFPVVYVGVTYRINEGFKQRRMERENGGTSQDFSEGMTVD